MYEWCQYSNNWEYFKSSSVCIRRVKLKVSAPYWLAPFSLCFQFLALGNITRIISALTSRAWIFPIWFFFSNVNYLGFYSNRFLAQPRQIRLAYWLFCLISSSVYMATLLIVMLYIVHPLRHFCLSACTNGAKIKIIITPHVNARPHVSLDSQKTKVELGWEDLSHAPYSSVSGTSDTPCASHCKIIWMENHSSWWKCRKVSKVFLGCKLRSVVQERPVNLFATKRNYDIHHLSSLFNPKK